jgi:hypothetical protein
MKCEPLFYTSSFTVHLRLGGLTFSTQITAYLPGVPGEQKKKVIAILVCSFMGSVGLDNILKTYLPIKLPRIAVGTIMRSAMTIHHRLVAVKHYATTSMKLLMKVMTTSQ